MPIKDGVYEVDNLKDGIYTMRVTKQWYKPVTIQVMVQGPTIQNVAMVPNLSLLNSISSPGWSMLKRKVRYIWAR